MKGSTKLYIYNIKRDFSVTVFCELAEGRKIIPQNCLSEIIVVTLH